MIDRPSRRHFIKRTATLAVAGVCGMRHARDAHAEGVSGSGQGAFSSLDAALRAATSAGELPGVVALAANQDGVLYEGIFGKRRLPDGPAMTRDTVFRVASMV